MTYQIDQSGKVEQTNKPTILAISNGEQFSILLRASDKRLIQEIYRSFFGKSRHRQYIYEVFSALLYILISHVKPRSKIIVDIEYPGQQSLIKLLLFKYYNDHDQNPPSNLEFGLIGKSSPAHNLGYNVFKKKQKPSKTIEVDEVISIIFPAKKTGYSSINGTEGS